MKKIRALFIVLQIIGFFLLPITVYAQSYSFEVPFTEVQAYIESDGTLSLQYIIEFQNRSNAPENRFILFLAFFAIAEIFPFDCVRKLIIRS